jgi:hypothetical protein
MKTITTRILLFALLALSVSACSRKELNKDDDTVNEAKTYYLLEQRQRVIRYNCQDQITSDKIETTKAPIDYVSIKPNSYKNLYGSSFDNLTMGTHAGSTIDYTDFTIDINPGFLNLEVAIGTNEISYKFYYCSQFLPPPKETLCAVQPEIRESGSVFINVVYESIELPGQSVIKPTPESCLPPKP